MSTEPPTDEASSGEPRNAPGTRQRDRPLDDPAADGRRAWGDRPEDYLGVGSRTIMGIVFAVLYIVTFGPRTGWFPAVVSGILGGAVIWLLLREIDARVKRRRARQAQHRR